MMEKHTCEKCGNSDEVLPLIKSYTSMELEYKCADCIIKESWERKACG